MPSSTPGLSSSLVRTPYLLINRGHSSILHLPGATTSTDDPPNSHVAIFDAALPGSQPVRTSPPPRRYTTYSPQPPTDLPKTRPSTRSARGSCPQLHHSFHLPLRPQALLLPRPTRRLSNHTILPPSRPLRPHHALSPRWHTPSRSPLPHRRHQASAAGAGYG